MSIDPDDPNDEASFIPTEHLAAIGRIANAWSALEFAIDSTTWQLAMVPDMVGACMTAQMLSISSKMGALVALAELRGLSKASLDKLNKFTGGRISVLQEARNRTVHDTRMIHQGTDEVTRLQITARGPLVFGFQPEPTSNLHKTRKKIEKVIRDYYVLRDELLNEYNSLPEKSGRQLLDIRRVQEPSGLATYSSTPQPPPQPSRA